MISPLVYPSKEQFLDDAGRFNLIPLSLETRADFETPLSLFQKVKGRFLLESVEQNGQVGRYSFIALGELARFELNGKTIRITSAGKTETFTEENPLDKVRSFFKEIHAPDYGDRLPPFYGGAIGYLGYETVAYFEKIPVSEKGKIVPDGILIIPETLLAYDNMKRSVQLIESVSLAGSGKNPSEIYEAASEKLRSLFTKIQGNLVYETVPPFKDENTAPKHLTSEREYEKGVEKIREYIGAGEIIQAVLSQQFSIATKAPAFELYRSLRVLNPSPYLYFLDFGEFQIVGSSPEVMVKLKNGELVLKPIAGTRRRGTSAAEDEHLATELIRDPKERAEHLMLVDLGRNDLGRVAIPGSVEVADYMAVEKYSHVMHIVSTVRALVDPSKDAFDVIRATFPAGTLSGAPKIRAMQILSELEPVARGPYGGMILNLGFSGNMDSCITIRTLVLKNGTATLQAGAGIVADSVPAKEWEECRNKAGALIAAIEDTRRRHAP